MMKNNKQAAVGVRMQKKTGMTEIRERVDLLWIGVMNRACIQDPGIDGILVTVGLCIIALLLCIVMKNSLTEFIQGVVKSMTKEASDILSGTRV